MDVAVDPASVTVDCTGVVAEFTVDPADDVVEPAADVTGAAVELTVDPTDDVVEPAADVTGAAVELTVDPTDEVADPAADVTGAAVELTVDPADDDVEPADDVTGAAVEFAVDPADDDVEPAADVAGAAVEFAVDPVEEVVDFAVDPADDDVEPAADVAGAAVEFAVDPVEEVVDGAVDPTDDVDGAGAGGLVVAAVAVELAEPATLVAVLVGAAGVDGAGTSALADEATPNAKRISTTSVTAKAVGHGVRTSLETSPLSILAPCLRHVAVLQARYPASGRENSRDALSAPKVRNLRTSWPGIAPCARPNLCTERSPHAR